LLRASIDVNSPLFLASNEFFYRFKTKGKKMNNETQNLIINLGFVPGEKFTTPQDVEKAIKQELGEE
jgi:hypothetical protein